MTTDSYGHARTPIAPPKAGRQVMQYVLLGLLCSLLALVTSRITWNSSVLGHTVLETATVTIALMAGLIALVRFLNRPSNTFLFITAACIGAAALETFHTLILFDTPVEITLQGMQDLDSWSWVAARSFLPFMLLIGLPYIRRDDREGLKAHRPPRWPVFTATALMVVLTISALASMQPASLPPVLGLARPAELAPALLYGAALVGFMRRDVWRHKSFAHWLNIALIVQFMAHGLFMVFSTALFDTAYNVAHVLSLLGQAFLFIGILFNIRSLYVANETSAAELRRSQVLFRTFIDHSPAAICIRDPESRILALNRRYAELHGITEEEAVGSRGESWLPEEWLNTLVRRDQEVMASGKPSEVEYKRDLPDGSTKYRQSIKFPLTGDNGEIFGIGHFSIDVSDWRLAQKQLNRQALIWRQIQEGVLIVSQNGRIEDLNPSAEAIFGYSRDEILSDPTIQLVAGDSPADFRAKMLETVRREGSWSGELTCLRKDGNEIVLESHIVPMTGDDAEVTGFVAVNRDISARVAFEESLKQAKLDAEVANRAKSGFLATMSHEIRTPMNGVMGMANLLLDTELDEAQRQYAEVIMTSGNALLDLINDILDVSKLEAGRVDLTEEEFNPLEVIENARNLMKPRADEKGIALNALVQPGMPTCLIGDPGRLRQILLNLIGNAIKFTGDGAVSLNASVSRPQNGQVELRFEVTDTGIGIPEDVRGRLFERFVQADASTTSQFGGTGLGLAICRELCHLMDGEIGVDSVEGEGSTFWFTVRLAVVGAMPVGEDTTIERMPEMADNNTAPDGAELPLVLLAEDNEVNQLVAVATLTKLGYRTEVVENGEQAVEAVKTRRFAAVIMDLQMPVMDGLQATQMIRALDDAQASIPIIALTADAMKGDRERCLAAGIDDYLTKPLDKAQLDETLQRIIADTRSDAA